MPMLAPISTRWPSTSKGSAISFEIRCATSSETARCSAPPVRITANSSPPRRAGTSHARSVACCMAEGIVDALEAVEIHQQDRVGCAGAGQVDLPQLRQEEGPVRKSGQGIGLRELQHALVRLRKLQRIAAGKTEIDGKEQGGDDPGREQRERPG